VVDREGGRDIGIERLLGAHFTLPDLCPALLGEPIYVVADEGALEIASHHRVEQVAVADAVDFERDLGGVDADHWNAALSGARQYISLAGEADRRLAVAYVDIALGRVAQ